MYVYLGLCPIAKCHEAVPQMYFSLVEVDVL